MKAVIVEIRGETAAALGRDGTVFKVKNRAYAVGQTIDVRRGVRSLRRQIAVSGIFRRRNDRLRRPRKTFFRQKFLQSSPQSICSTHGVYPCL